jgi:hypothetical protein
MAKNRGKKTEQHTKAIKKGVSSKACKVGKQMKPKGTNNCGPKKKS